jgi:hypothetical protein
MTLQITDIVESQCRCKTVGGEKWNYAERVALKYWQKTCYSVTLPVINRQNVPRVEYRAPR